MACQNQFYDAFFLKAGGGKNSCFRYFTFISSGKSNYLLISLLCCVFQRKLPNLLFSELEFFEVITLFPSPRMSIKDFMNNIFLHEVMTERKFFVSFLIVLINKMRSHTKTYIEKVHFMAFAAFYP